MREKTHHGNRFRYRAKRVVLNIEIMRSSLLSPLSLSCLPSADQRDKSMLKPVFIFFIHFISFNWLYGIIDDISNGIFYLLVPQMV
jgi:hypothetical protein